MNHLETNKKKQNPSQNTTKKEKNQEEIKCLFCPRNFFDIRKLQVHIKTKHNIKTDCLFCGKKNQSVGALHNQVVAEHSKKQEKNEKMAADMKKVVKSDKTTEKPKGESQTKIKSYDCENCDWTFQ